MQKIRNSDTNPKMTMRIYLIDWSVFIFKAIFAGRMNHQVKPTYMALSMLLGCLRLAGLTKYDRVILACDGRGNWRKDVDPNYKANRKAFRESFEDINWDEEFNNFNVFIKQLDSSTPFYILKLNKLEADDIIASAVRFYKDYNCIIVSTDKDYDQLLSLSNVRIFSSSKKEYRTVTNPYKSLAQKIQREETDNLTSEISSDLDAVKREELVSLLTLPKWVQDNVQSELELIGPKLFDVRALPYQSLRPRLEMLLNNEKEESDSSMAGKKTTKKGKGGKK